MCVNGSRLALLVCVAAVAAACGGSATVQKPQADVAAVEAALAAQGDVQEVACEELGREEIEGVEQVVFMCAFSEGEDASGRMRAANRCFVLSAEGTVTDVTRVLRDRGSCPVTSP